VHPVAGFLQAINQPVPVKCGLNHDTLQLLLIGPQFMFDPFQIVIEASFVEDSVRLIDNGYDAVVGMQIDPGIQFHWSAPLSGCSSMLHLNDTAAGGSRLDDYQVLPFDLR
jgi:hypothetical protein